MPGDSGDGSDEQAPTIDGADADAVTVPDDQIVLQLPDAARSEFKDPFGLLFSEVPDLLADHGAPIITVGDIVTFHFEAAGHRPDVAVVDGRTEREVAPEHVREALEERPNRVWVENPAGTITADLLEAVANALASEVPTTIVVEGEEDLATVPAVLAAPDGATVVYGQPGEGMVAIEVTEESRERFRELLGVFEGDRVRAAALLEN